MIIDWSPSNFYPIFSGQNHGVICGCRYSYDAFIFVSICQVYSLWQYQSGFIASTQSTAIAKPNTIQFALIVDVQTMIPTDAHIPDGYILF